MKRDSKSLLLEQLKKTPIIQIACERSGVGRATYYRWRKDDLEFAKSADAAILDGRFLINDMAESQLIAAVKERNLPAITYWLRHHHPDYTDTIQIKHAIQDESLTPEQEALIREALRLASASRSIVTGPNKQEDGQQKHNSAGNGGGDDQGQESPSGDH